jgi:[ribosomal protein S5]-alanine N-acetyltransferase
LKNNIILNTERLTLKPLNRSYLSDEYLSCINDQDVVRFLDTQVGSSKADLENNEIFAWAIEIKNSNKHIGNIKINPIDY